MNFFGSQDEGKTSQNTPPTPPKSWDLAKELSGGFGRSVGTQPDTSPASATATSPSSNANSNDVSKGLMEGFGRPTETVKPASGQWLISVCQTTENLKFEISTTS